MLASLQVLVVVLVSAAAIIQYLVNQKDTRYSKSRSWRRARVLPVSLSVAATFVQFAVGQLETKSKQAEIDAQRKQLARIEANVEALVTQGKLSRDDAARILVVISEPVQSRENLGIKVIPKP
jgi:hypothetical protein